MRTSEAGWRKVGLDWDGEMVGLGWGKVGWIGMEKGWGWIEIGERWG